MGGLPSPGIAVPSSAMVEAPVHARTPPISQTTRAAPGDETWVSIDPGDVKMPLPITMLMTMAKASAVPRFLENDPLWASLSREEAGPFSGSRWRPASNGLDSRFSDAMRNELYRGGCRQGKVSAEWLRRA